MPSIYCRLPLNTLGDIGIKTFFLSRFLLAKSLNAKVSKHLIICECCKGELLNNGLNAFNCYKPAAV